MHMCKHVHHIKGQGPRMGENGPMSECHKIISGNSTHHGIS